MKLLVLWFFLVKPLVGTTTDATIVTKGPYPTQAACEVARKDALIWPTYQMIVGTMYVPVDEFPHCISAKGVTK